jgi:glyoxylate/hydroxypyruvate reductase A
MTTRILFAARPDSWAAYEAPLRAALEARGLDHDLGTRLPPETVDYIVYAPSSPVQDFTPFTRLKAVLNLWAGVEDVVGNPTLTVPLARMVDPGLTQGMVEWVTAHVLRHHLGIDAQITGQDGVWRKHLAPLAADRPVTLLGLGALGQACARALQGLGFPVTGWSRTQKNLPDLDCRAGPDGLASALGTAQILILLLPDTPATRNILSDSTLALLPQGAFLLNPGRGTLIDDDALLRAIERGQIAHATLDVFRTEPLPPSHPFWAHPRITVTPHIAAETRPVSAAAVIADNIRRGEDGLPFRHLVDRGRGY